MKNILILFICLVLCFHGFSQSVSSSGSGSGTGTATKSSIGLGNVDNTSDKNKPLSTADSIALANKVAVVSGKQLSTNDYSTAEQSKLTGIATGATANSTDANLRDRTTHTGVQAISTVTSLQTSLNPIPLKMDSTRVNSLLTLKQNTLSAGTGFVKSSGSTISYDNSNYYLATNPSNYGSLSSISSTATGLTYTAGTGVISLTSGYVVPATADQTNWNGAYSNRITSLTTTGSSGVSSITTNVLNVPSYTLAGLGGQPTLSGTGFIKATGTTISYDNSAYLTSITSSNVTTALGFTPYNATNPSGYVTNASLASTYFPLIGGTLTGTAGTGIIGFANQSANPATPASGFNLFSNSTGSMSWKGSNGFVRAFDGTAVTADRAYTLPNASGTFGLLESVQSFTGTTNNFTGGVGIGRATVPVEKLEVTGNLLLTTAGNKLKIATGTNASMGTATLSGGTVTVSTTAAKTGSQIWIMYQGTISGANSILIVSNITDSTSFGVTAITPASALNTTNAGDNSVIKWWIIN